MKNKISDLRDHMFAALERLGNEELTPEQLKVEVERSQAISEVGKVIVESAKTEIMYAKLTGKGKEDSSKFLEQDVKPIERVKGKYSNKSPLGIASAM